jgi:CRISPR-associated protein Csd1
MLHQLIDYAKREGLDPEPGFTTHEICWEVHLGVDGKFINVIPLGDDDGGEDTPKCPLMHNMQAGGRSHFLVETVQTVALLFKKNEEDKKINDINIRHQYFSKLIQEAAEGVSLLKPLALFLSSPDQVMALNSKLKGNAKPGDRLKWRVAGIDVVANPEVRDWWRSWRKKDLAKGKVDSTPKRVRKKAGDEEDESSSGDMVCFLSGEIVTPLLTHNKVKKLITVGGQPGGDVIVGCDKDAFRSFGLKKSSNAAMGDFLASGYVDALNHLIKNHSHKLANALVVYWFKDTVESEDDLWPSLLSLSPKTAEANARQIARELLKALSTGKRPDLANNRYYAMTLSGYSGRVMIRDWMEGSFEELIRNITAWFDDLEMTNRTGKNVAQDPKLERAITCLLQPRKKRQKYEDWVKPIGHARLDLLHAAIQRRVIPFHVIARIASQLPVFFMNDELNRVLFGKQDDSENAGLYLSLLYARMGLIKAYFIRKGGNHNMSAYLNKEHPEPAYHCGRLLSMLASLQREALGDVGAGVVQRYYMAASQTPGLTIGRLMGNAKNHLGKVSSERPKLAFWYEEQIAEIMSRIKDYIPRTLDLEQQTIFALGYYQQIAANRAGKNNTNESSKGDQQ